MMLHSRWFWIYLISGSLLAIPSLCVWGQEPFIVTYHEFDFFLGLIPGTGEEAPLGILLVGRILHFLGLLVIGISYFFLLKEACISSYRLSWKDLIWASLLVLPFLLYLPWLSPDVFFYLGTGWLDGIQGLNPYVATIRDALGENELEISSNIYPPWLEIITPYGPLFIKFSSLVVLLTGSHVKLSLFSLKIIFVALHFLSAYFAYQIAKLLRMKEKAVTLAFLINPALLFSYIGTLHNDGVMLTFILLGILFFLHSHFFFSTVSFALASGFKYFPILIFPFFLAHAFKQCPSWKQAGKVSLFGFIFTLLALAPSFLYEEGFSNFIRLFVGSDQLLFNPLYMLLSIWMKITGWMTYASLKIFLKIIFLLLAFLLILKILKEKKSLSLLFQSIVSLLFLYFLIGSPEIHEWYLGWFLIFIFWINDQAYYQTAMLLSIAINPIAIFIGPRLPFLYLLGCFLVYLILWKGTFLIFKKKILRPSPLFL